MQVTAITLSYIYTRCSCKSSLLASENVYTNQGQVTNKIKRKSEYKETAQPSGAVSARELAAPEQGHPAKATVSSTIHLPQGGG